MFCFEISVPNPTYPYFSWEKTMAFVAFSSPPFPFFTSKFSWWNLREALDQGLLRLELQCSRAEPPQVRCDFRWGTWEKPLQKCGKIWRKPWKMVRKNVANHGGWLIFVKKSSKISGKMIDNGYMIYSGYVIEPPKKMPKDAQMATILWLELTQKTNWLRWKAGTTFPLRYTFL